MIYVTGDCHGKWSKLKLIGSEIYDHPDEEHYVIVCGDFGIWEKGATEDWWLSWLDEKPFTTLFVDGNHENFDRLNSEFEVVDYHGGKAHKISDKVYHLMRGYVFEFCGKTFFTFGGAASHDVYHGILEPEDYPSRSALYREYRRLSEAGKMVRINHISWWAEEMPSLEEKTFGLETLRQHDFKVDYVISHCGPQSIIEYIDREFQPDSLTDWFDVVRESLTFEKWFFGHYHEDMKIGDNFQCLYWDTIRIV